MKSEVGQWNFWFDRFKELATECGETKSGVRNVQSFKEKCRAATKNARRVDYGPNVKVWTLLMALGSWKYNMQEAKNAVGSAMK
jgi:hypothetical protein